MTDTSQTEYRIEFQIRRREPGDDYFVDIGFGSSGGWAEPSQCSHMVGSAVDNYDWETEPGMPDPLSVKRAVEQNDD